MSGSYSLAEIFHAGTAYVERGAAHLRIAAHTRRGEAALGAENLFLRSEEVGGIGSLTYTVSDQAGSIIRATTDRLLAGLRVYE